jgi:hypothetical protein
MNFSVTRSKPDACIFLSGHLAEHFYTVLPNNADDLVASLQVDATKIDAIGQRIFRENVVLVAVICL